MKVGIISDTHDRQRAVAKATEIFGEHKVDYILHGGDIVSADTAKVLAEVEGAKFIGVFGNCDREKPFLRSLVRSLGGEIHSRVFRGEIGGRQIFMTHKPSTMGEVARSNNFDLVVYGHTHMRFMQRVGKTLVVNPGTSTAVVVKLDDMTAQQFRLR